jgi:hypothetical protein
MTIVWLTILILDIAVPGWSSPEPVSQVGRQSSPSTTTG